MLTLYAMKAVRWGSLAASSLGKERMCPRCFFVRFLGRKPSEPLRGASNLRCDMVQVWAEIEWWVVAERATSKSKKKMQQRGDTRQHEHGQQRTT